MFESRIREFVSASEVGREACRMRDELSEFVRHTRGVQTDGSHAYKSLARTPRTETMLQDETEVRWTLDALTLPHDASLEEVRERIRTLKETLDKSMALRPPLFERQEAKTMQQRLDEIFMLLRWPQNRERFSHLAPIKPIETKPNYPPSTREKAAKFLLRLIELSKDE